MEMEEDLENSDLELLTKIKLDLNKFTERKAKSCIFRSKADYQELGEKPTKYFISLKKSRFNARTCNALFDGKGNLINDTKGILRLQENFYRELYSSDTSVNFELENSFNVRIPDELKDNQDKELNIEEIAEAVKQLPNNKTCGLDRIPVDFYKVFWCKLKTVFFKLLHEIYIRQKLTTRRC